MKPKTPNRPGCGGYVLASILILALAIPAFAWPQLSVRLIREKWGAWVVDIYCPASEDCESVEVIKSWEGAKIHRLAPDHLQIDVDNMVVVPAFWVRVNAPGGIYTDHGTQELRIYEQEKPALKGVSLLPSCHTR